LTTSLQADKIFQKIFGQQKEIAIIRVQQFSFCAAYAAARCTMFAQPVLRV
jgi:hypothetical protein